MRMKRTAQKVSTVVEFRPTTAIRVQPGRPETAGAPPLDARVEGRRVVVEAAEEIVFRCGKASITLRKNGRVVVRGTHVETRSAGMNRVKGASVQIN